MMIHFAVEAGNEPKKEEEKSKTTKTQRIKSYTKTRNGSQFLENRHNRIQTISILVLFCFDVLFFHSNHLIRARLIGRIGKMRAIDNKIFRDKSHFVLLFKKMKKK